MKITVNGEAREVEEGCVLALEGEAYDSMEVNCEALVVQRNDDIIARDAFADTAIADGDALELVRFVGGG